MATDVSSLITSQQQFASDWANRGNEFLSRITDLANTQFDAPGLMNFHPGWTYKTAEAQGKLDALRPPRPAMPTISATAPDAPASPTFSQIIPVSVAEFLRTAPQITIPAAPSAVLPNAPGAPALSDVALPASPVVTMPIAPILVDVALPPPPSIAIPSFVSTLPIDDIVAPTDRFSFHEQAYQSQLMDAVTAKLMDDLEGGYGIEPADEAALWDRARSREIATSMGEQEAIVRASAGRGFPLPTGALFSALAKAQQFLQDKVSTVSRDIALKRADLYVDNRKFTMEQVRQLETTLVGYHSSVMERALNASKAIVEASLSIYDSQVKRYNAKLDAYKTEASVFEAKIRASLSQAEIYRTQMEGSRLGLEAQAQRVTVYRAQLEGVNSIVDIYKTRMEAANVNASIQRTKMEAFRAQIDAYAAQVQAKTAEFGMFEARIRGETAKLAGFETELRAYQSTVEAAKVRSDVQLGNLRAQVEQANAKATVYGTQVEQFKATLSAQAETLRGVTDVYKTDISAYATAVSALESALKLELSEGQENARINIASAEINVRNALARLEALKAAALLRTTNANHGASFVKEVVAAAAGSIQTLGATVQSS